MNSKNIAITGAGLLVAGIGLSAIGAALILPAVVALTASAVGKAGERLISEVERASTMVGTVAGTLQRSLAEARAAATEIRKASSSGSKEAV